LYVGIIGDFSHYWIAESLGMTIRVLTELHYATNQIGYYIRSELDGMPVLEEAFARVTLGS
jgi:HK97 family phage major capsid protein